MSREQILSKKAGIILAVIGILLSLLPAIRMADGTKKMIIQLITNKDFINAEYFTGIILLIILVGGLLVHILNLILWCRNKIAPYIGVMGFSVGVFIAMIMYGGITTFFTTSVMATFPFTIWQCLRIPVILLEAINRKSGDEFFAVFFGNNKRD